MAVSSISRRLVAIKVFFGFLQQEGLLGRNVTEAMDSPRLWRLLPGVLSLRDVDRLLQAPAGNDRFALRDKALLEGEKGAFEILVRRSERSAAFVLWVGASYGDVTSRTSNDASL